MRNAFADEITNIAQEDERVVLLSGDIGNRLFDNYKKHANDRFYNCGIAEANMMSVAAGLGLSGLRPIVYTITPFTTTRCYEQIRVGVCYHNSPVIIVGTGSGLSYSTLGPTHHSLEDIAILRALPGMKVFCPCDALEVRAGLRAALNQDSPVYIRLGKKGEPNIHPDIPKLELGKSYNLHKGDDVCILSTGNAINISLAAREELEAKGISVRLDSFHTIKPLDYSVLKDVFDRYKAVVIVEEHNVIGGFYGAVAEWYAKQTTTPCAKIVGISMEDKFYHRIGTQNQVRQEGKFTSESIIQNVLKALEE